MLLHLTDSSLECSQIVAKHRCSGHGSVSGTLVSVQISLSFRLQLRRYLFNHITREKYSGVVPTITLPDCCSQNSLLCFVALVLVA